LDRGNSILGIRFPPIKRGKQDGQQSSLRSAIGKTAFMAAWSAEHSMTIEQVIAAALQEAPVG
jgi:hypothetical protein